MSTRSRGSSSAWALITVSELTAGMKVTCRPRAANRPSRRATKKPAESTAGTTATFRAGCSTAGRAASPPSANLGRNRIARIVTAATAPTTSAALTARANLRAMGSASFRRPGDGRGAAAAGQGRRAGVHRALSGAGPEAAWRTCTPAGGPRSIVVPVAREMVVQVSVRDIGQLTDFGPRLITGSWSPWSFRAGLVPRKPALFPGSRPCSPEASLVPGQPRPRAGRSAGVPRRAGRRARQRAGVEIPELGDALAELPAVPGAPVAVVVDEVVQV